MKSILIITILSVFTLSCSHHKMMNKTVVNLESKSNSKTTGVITIWETNNSIKVIANIKGLKPNSEHGFHIHEKGDCSAKDAKSAGGHFSPEMSKHGAPDTIHSHLGDMGNLQSNSDGVASVSIEIKKLNISQNNKFSVKAKAFIIHQEKDDLKSQPSGNAGARIACGVI
jgi:Cu-Zn family superoxide dismutase